MNKITAQQKKAYLANPNHCPICNSEDIESAPISTDDEEHLTNNVECFACGAEWKEVHTLTNIILL